MGKKGDKLYCKKGWQEVAVRLGTNPFRHLVDHPLVPKQVGAQTYVLSARGGGEEGQKYTKTPLLLKFCSGHPLPFTTELGI